MNLDMISNFFSKYRRTLLYIGVFVVAIFAVGDTAFAIPDDGNKGADAPSGAVKIVQGALQIVSALLGAVTSLVSLFLSPGWTSGQIFGMQVHLKEIWILVSNVVYFIFAMILIVIAFMNIIGKSDKWELKQALPRFVIGVLIVPFSWFFVQFVVSVSAILTVGVLTLPYDTFKEYDFYKQLEATSGGEGKENSICLHPTINLGDSGTTGSEKGDKVGCKDWGSIYSIISNGNNIFGIISIYTYGIISPSRLDEIERHILAADTGAIAGIADLLLKIVFDLIFIVVYFILMAALFLALFVRGVWLWMYMMLSPAFGLLYFFEKGSEGVGSEAKFSIKEFISLALVPVYVSAALSFGLLFIFVAAHGMSQPGASDNAGITIESTKDGEETITLLGDYKFTILGFQGKGASGIVGGVGSALGNIIIQLFGIVILWIAVMAALRQSETTEKIVKPIAEFGGSVGKLVASSPMYAPIIPAGGGKTLSAASLPTVSSGLQSAVQTSTTERGQKFLGDNFPSLNSDLQGLRNSIRDTKSTFDTYLGNDEKSVASPTQVADQLNKYLKEGKNLEVLRKTNEFHDVLKRTGKKVGVDLDSTDLSNKEELKKAIIQINNKLNGVGGILGRNGKTVNDTISAASLEEMIGGGSSKSSSGAPSSEGKFSDFTASNGYKDVSSLNKTKVKIEEETGLFEVVQEVRGGKSSVINLKLETSSSDTSLKHNDRKELEKLVKDLGFNQKQLTEVLKTANFTQAEELSKQVIPDA